MLGYALTTQHFPGQRTLFTLVLVMLIIPVVATFVPLFGRALDATRVEQLPAAVCSSRRPRTSTVFQRYVI